MLGFAHVSPLEVRKKLLTLGPQPARHRHTSSVAPFIAIAIIGLHV